MQCEQTDALLVGLDVEPVDLGVARDDLARLDRVAIYQRFHRLGDLALDQPAHLEQVAAHGAQLLLVLAVGMLRLQVVHLRLPPGDSSINRNAR